MSVDFGSANDIKWRSVGILLGIIVASVVLIFFGTQWLRANQGWNLIGEVAYSFLILVLALVAYDKLLVR